MKETQAVRCLMANTVLPGGSRELQQNKTTGKIYSYHYKDADRKRLVEYANVYGNDLSTCWLK